MGLTVVRDSKPLTQRLRGREFLRLIMPSDSRMYNIH
jgi:hypothetical protein